MTKLLSVYFGPTLFTDRSPATLFLFFKRVVLLGTYGYPPGIVGMNDGAARNLQLKHDRCTSPSIIRAKAGGTSSRVGFIYIHVR